MLKLNPTDTPLHLNSRPANRMLSFFGAAFLALILTSCDKAPDWLKPEPPPEPPTRILNLDDPEQTNDPTDIADPGTQPSTTVEDPGNDPGTNDELPEDPDVQGSTDPEPEIIDIDFPEPEGNDYLGTPPIHTSAQDVIDAEVSEADSTSSQTDTGIPLSDTENDSSNIDDEIPHTPANDTILADSSLPMMEELQETAAPTVDIFEAPPTEVPTETQATIAELPPIDLPNEEVELFTIPPLIEPPAWLVQNPDPPTTTELAEEQSTPLPFSAESIEPMTIEAPETLVLEDLPLDPREVIDAEQQIEPDSLPGELVQENVSEPSYNDETSHGGEISAPVLETLMPAIPSELAAELPEPERAEPLPTLSVAMMAQEGEPVPDESEEGEETEEEEEEEPFDPIKENGEIFTGWPDPSLALVITGHQNGYLEPCGCAGLDRMKGGLSRRMTLFSELEDERGWPTISLDVGGLCKSFGRQAELKFHTTVEAMTLMDYSAIGLGGNDLRLPAQELYARTTNTGSTRSPFLSANVAVYGFALEDMRPYDVIEKNGWKIGVTSVLGDQAREELNNTDIETASAHDQLSQIVPQMRDEQCDALILLAYATMEETEALAEAYPYFNIIATSSGDYEPPARPRQVNGVRTVLVEVGEKGMNAVVFGFYSEPEKQIRYQRVPLDSRFEAAAKAKMLMEQYQEQLQVIGFEGLGLRPSPHIDAETNGNFVGSKACDSCHGDSYDVWKESGHSHAWATLRDLDPPRIYDPECVSCHVVGWDPEEYFPYESGFWNEETTPKLVNVGCESCHGPGENHIDAEIRGDEPTQLSMRAAMRLTMEEADREQCITCHDLDNSPDFDFETYWPKIVHDEDAEEYEE
jgi:hypothetical protein